MNDSPNIAAKAPKSKTIRERPFSEALDILNIKSNFKNFNPRNLTYGH